MIASAGGTALLSEEDELLPIRMIEALVYCPRQAWYRFVAGDDTLNVAMTRGLLRHATMEERAATAPPDTAVYRHLMVRAPRLGVVGVIDEVAIAAASVAITEYKTARLAPHVWPGAAMQVVVQALALREHATGPDWHGPPLPAQTMLRVYFADSRRYRPVPWSAASEQAARAAVAAARRVLASPTPPDGLAGSRCARCQVEPFCLPLSRRRLEALCHDDALRD
jgi:CRISPR-associated exonuclease Cas4